MNIGKATKANHATIFPIIPRKSLDFRLDEEIPRFWFGGCPFKSRFYDVFSIRLPEGERFFVSCVRDYKDKITDPVQAQEIRDFTMQEGQHSQIHRLLNERLKSQGIPVEQWEADNARLLDRCRKFIKPIPLAQTVAGEHLTATISHVLFENAFIFADADRHIAAIFAWHAAEEIEHKSVAFDVFKQYAQGGYLLRVGTILFMTPTFFLHTFFLMNKMFKIDGFDAYQRLALFARGSKWLLGKNGVLRLLAPHYLSFFRPGFDPWDIGETGAYELWLKVFNQTSDPIEAFRVVLADVNQRHQQQSADPKLRAAA